MEALLKDLFYSISDDVFALFPEYVRGVVLAFEVKNTKSPPRLVEMLRSAEASVRDRLNLEELTAHPQISSWREAFRRVGIKPSDFRPSIEAMARRVLRHQELPSINALVDIGNILSLRHLLPIGAHALDNVTEDIALRMASGEEEFVPFGSEQIEHPDPGEIVFVEGNTVLTRRWSWRQANHTMTLPATAALEFNVDGLPPVTKSEVEGVCRELMGLVQQFCGGQTHYDTLIQQNPRIGLTR
jgi:DNA/RNA-binding domain of Phe-tRNA-synthetase-like protein